MSTPAKSSGGIRSSLLTPYKRVGLSRKVRTPLSHSKPVVAPSPSEAQEVKSAGQNVSTAVLTEETTPVNYKAGSRKRHKSTPIQGAGDKATVSAVAANIRKCLALGDSTASINNSSNVSDTSCTEKIESEEEDFVVKKPAKRIKKTVCSTDESMNDTTSKENIVDNKNIKQESKKVEKKFRKRILSMKKSCDAVSTQGSEIEFMPTFTSSQKSVSELPFNLEKLPLLYEEPLTAQSDLIPEDDFVASPKNNMRRKSTANGLTECSVVLDRLPLPSSKEIDDFEDSKGVIDYRKEINMLKEQIERKEKVLSDLKRAESYQKKHDMENLKMLREMWKSGCMKGLYDLLPHVQAHGPIDMGQLLRKLNIPNHLISCTENGELR